ncbi:MAG: mannose-1-phosphate guanylyltransferase/mannose-6-phosphate isomerase [Pseudomonadaceae bacterium]|nr:mannose-1-phosphate guanylyltransferase/mannose-6-phosphate isomerase [Pseudomonadaceae bacterium]
MTAAPSRNIHALIMAGGSGTRLWPMSRQMFPKQFSMSLTGGKSLLHATAERLQPLVPSAHVWVITGAEHATGAAYHDIQPYPHLIEPVGRNTAPAIALTAAHLVDVAGDPIMLVLPADHAITDTAAFHAALEIGAEQAEAGKLVTFGITPTRAETGYGYIKAKTGEGQALPVEKFVEKPDAATAETFVKDGAYSWNSGMFMARASVMLAEVEKHLPEVAKVIAAIRADAADKGWQPAINAHFADMPNISIDYGVMEKSDKVMVVPCSIGWSDVGAWDAVFELAEKDENGNAIQAPAITVDTRNTFISGAKRLVATIGVEDLCIVDTPDALLITHKNQAQKVKDVVAKVKELGGEQHLIHTTAKRPWGSYTVLEDEEGRGYKLKRIEVRPGGRLSLQSHQHRSEHWVVVAGTATVTCDDQVITLTPGQSTYLPLGCKHRLENLGKIPVKMIEVQVGEYLGEDDIIRYDDVYGRQ